jgi:hypothetical protein
MRTIRFLEKRIFERVGLPAITYEADSVHTLKDDHARRWVTRGAAEYVASEPVSEPTTEPVQVPVLDPTKLASDATDLTEALHDDTVASAPVVAGQDGGDPGVGTVDEPVRRRGRPAGRRSSNRGQ